MKDKIILGKNANMVTRVIDKETMLLPIYKTSKEINCIYALNKSASRTWELINGKRQWGEIKKQILQEFDATAEEVDKQMQNFLKDLKKIAAIKEVENAQETKI